MAFFPSLLPLSENRKERLTVAETLGIINADLRGKFKDTEDIHRAIRLVVDDIRYGTSVWQLWTQTWWETRVVQLTKVLTRRSNVAKFGKANVQVHDDLTGSGHVCATNIFPEDLERQIERNLQKVFVHIGWPQ